MNPLEKSELVFPFAILMGLALPHFSALTNYAVMPLMALAMVLSLRSVNCSLRTFSSHFSFSAKSLFLSYGVQPFFLILAAYLIIPNPDYFAGLVILAAVPPSISVIPFTYLLRGDVEASLVGEIINYVLAPVITFSIILIFIGSVINVLEVLRLLFLLIIIPLVISTILKKIPDLYFSFSKSIINLCFATILYSIIGLNSSLLATNLVSLAPVGFLLFIKIFVISIFIFFASLRFGASRERGVSYALFSGYKNAALASVFAYILVGVSASIPAVTHLIIEFIAIILFVWILKKFYKIEDERTLLYRPCRRNLRA